MTPQRVLINPILCLVAVAAVACESSRVGENDRAPDAVIAAEPADECPANPRIVEIRRADPADSAHHRQMRDLFMQNATQPNTTILLGPDVLLDFSDVEELPVQIARCVTIRSVAYFTRPSREDVAPVTPAGDVLARRRERGDVAINVRPEMMGERGPAGPVPEARSSTADGPMLKFGPHRASGNKVFLQVRCYPNVPDQADHVRISGFRLRGPSLDHQHVGDKGILIRQCVDVEISNMEVAGWGGEAIRVDDYENEYPRPVVLGEPWKLRRDLPELCKEPPWNSPEGRIGSPSQVRIFNNYIHHNQQPRTILEGHAGGYGVQVGGGAHAQIYQNVFAFNRHAIEGSGTMGGYEATRNLVLRYGGVHYSGAVTIHTHAFDIHGTGDNGMGGFAGARTVYSYNAFQFDADNAISIRGSPRCGVEISHNVFPHHGLEDDWGADAVKLYYREDLDVVKLGPSNTLDYNSFGKYGVCDFDGDGIDDLFLATGVSWWFSGMGEFPWRFLALRNERIERLRFGYFDADDKCDVVTDTGGAWMMSSGGTAAWYRLGTQYAPFAEVHFGRFDPSVRDHRPGKTRRTTHAFWRTRNGQWRITTLTGAGQGWRDVGSSGVPMSDLRFGDFTGDGVTDVLSVQRGRWAISESAVQRWDTLNPSLGDPVRGLLIADIDHNNIDDLIRLDYKPAPAGQFVRESYQWMVSYDGRTPWQPLKSYVWSTPGIVFNQDRVLRVFAGRFGVAPGAGTLTIDRAGIGRFFAPLETRRGAAPDWNSTFSY